MRKARFLILLLLFVSAFLVDTPASAQTKRADSLKNVLAIEKSAFNQFSLNQQIAGELVRKGYPDSVPHYLNQLYKLSAQLKNDSLLMTSYMTTNLYLDWKTDSKEAIEYTLKALAIAEQKYPSIIPYLNNALAAAYNDLHNFDKAVEYCKKALKGFDATEDDRPENRANTYFQLAHAYYNLGKIDSSLHYGQLSNELYPKSHAPEMQKFTSTVTADSYAQLGSDKLAEGYYNSSIEPHTPGKSYADAMAAGHYSFYLLQRHKIPDAKYYGIRGLQAAVAAQAKLPLLENVSFLRRIYEAAHQPDSAYYFAKLELAYRDSLFNQDKLYAVQDLAFKEQVREQEVEVKKAEEEVQRKHNLQYALIALALVTFVILFFLLSHSIIANQKLIRFFGIIALLITFEFINLYIHPYLAHTTNESPLLMLLAMVCVAALLVPLHHKLEHWVTHKLVEKNNRIRLAAARKTIEHLEKKVDLNSLEKNTDAQQQL